MKEFGFALQEWPFVALGAELGCWYVRIFIGFHSFLLGWVEWELDSEKPLTEKE